jgi:hypothetical protein
MLIPKFRNPMVAALIPTFVLAAAPSASAQTLLRYKFTPGESSRYVNTTEMVQKMQMGEAAPMTMTTTSRSEHTRKTQSVDAAGVATVMVTVDRVQMKLQSAQGVLVDYDTASGKEPEGTAKSFAQVANVMTTTPAVLKFNSRGEVITGSQQGIQEKVTKILPVAGQMGDLLSPEGVKKKYSWIVLPEEPVTPGQTWTRRTSFQVPALLGSMVTETKYEYQGTEDRNGVTLHKIAFTQQQQVAPGSEKTPGDKQKPLMKIKQGDTRGTIYFDNVHGRVVESTSKSKFQGETNVMEMHGIMETEGTERIALLPGNAAQQPPKP